MYALITTILIIHKRFYRCSNIHDIH